MNKLERVNYDRILELNGFKFGIKTLSAIHGLSMSRIRAIASNRDQKRIKELCEEGNKLFAPICKMSNIEYDVHYGCKTLTELVEKYGYKNSGT